jgi:hypothetical protein
MKDGDKLISISTHELSFTIDLVAEYKKWLLKEFHRENISESNLRTMIIHANRFMDFTDNYYWGEIE